jgi:hypothetical protein
MLMVYLECKRESPNNRTPKKAKVAGNKAKVILKAH